MTYLGPRPTRFTARARLTMLYGGLTVLTGTVVVALTYLLVRSRTSDPTGLFQTANPPIGLSPVGSAIPVPVSDSSVAAVAVSVHDTLLQTLLLYSALSLALLVMLATALGWWMAGRALRPIHRMTASARRISASNLHERIALTGPRDELSELADTFDALLDRLDAAFDSQRRFIANAAHELRTPLAISRATLQIELEEPSGDPDEIVAIRDKLLAINRRSEHLIDGLLVLATSDRGLAHRQHIDLDVLVTGVVRDVGGEAKDRGITVHTRVAPLVMAGDPVLMRHLINNLVLNAIRHNKPGGQVNVVLTAQYGLSIANTGPVIPADAVPTLFEPFRRLRTDRTGSVDGAGIGLSIARSIAHAHAADLRLRPNPDGGLTATFMLPRDQDHSGQLAVWTGCEQRRGSR